MGSGTSAIALQELLIQQYGWSVVAFCLAILFIFVGLLPIYLTITSHEVKLTYTPGQLDFLADLELLKGGHITYTDFMNKHSGHVYDINHVLTEALKSHRDMVSKAEQQRNHPESQPTPPNSSQQTQ